MKIRSNCAQGGGAPKDGSRHSEPDRIHWLPQRILRWVGALLVISVAAYIIHLQVRKPLLEVPMPGNPEKLEPQLHAYISGKIDWVRDAPRDMQRHAVLGIVYAVNGLWSEALKAFQNAAELNPKEPLAQLYAAVATQELGQLDQALQMFRQLAIQFPDYPPGYYRLGHALLRPGAVEEAESAFERLTVLAPREWRGFAGVGDAKLRRGDYAGAALWLEKAVRLEPAAKNAHYLLGMAYRGLGRMEEADLELRLGLNAKVYPIPDAWSETASQHMKLLQDQIEMANEYSQAGAPSKAVELLQQALSFHPQNLTLLNNLAITCNRSGQPQKARLLLQKMIQIDDRYLPAYITLSFNSQILGLNDEALFHAEKAISMSPNASQGFLAKANVLLALERDVEALAALKEAFRCDPQNAEIPIEMGDVYLHNLSRPADAMEHYEIASRLDSVFLPAHLRLANLHLSLGETNAARARIDTLRRISPNAPELAGLESRLRKALSR